MDALFSLILKMSFSASWVILVVLALRMIFQKAPKAYTFVLWLIVLLRLLCPIFPKTSFSPIPKGVSSVGVIENLVQTEERDSPVIVLPGGKEKDTLAQKPALPPVENVGEDVVTDEPIVSINPVLRSVWCLGMIAMSVYSIVSLVLLKRRLRVSMCLRENIYYADYIDSPFVMGVFRPRIYLPSLLPDDRAGYIIAHEQCHIRMLDPLVKVLFFAGLCLHWFNPLVWLAFFVMTRDMEMRCDEAVMKDMDLDARLDYAGSLLALASPRQRFAAAPLPFGEGNPQKRIKHILDYRKPALLGCVFVVAVVVVAAVCLLTDPAPKPANDNAVEFYTQVLEECKKDFSKFIPYLYFENDDVREVYCGNLDPLYQILDYKILETKQVNGNLSSFKVWHKTSYGDELIAYHFVCDIKGELYVILGYWLVPEEYSRGLNPEEYETGIGQTPSIADMATLVEH